MRRQLSPSAAAHSVALGPSPIGRSRIASPESRADPTIRSTRTVVIKFPDGQTEYWLTDQVFSSGETIRRNGHTWVVADVLDPTRSGGYLAVRLRDAARVEATSG